MSSSRPARIQETIVLVKEAQDGNRTALEDLFSRYLPRTRQIVRFRLGRATARSAELDDLVQDSLLNIFRNLDKFEQQSTGTFHNWLARCVETSIVDHFRRVNSQKRGGGKVVGLGEKQADDLSSSLFRKRPPTSSQILMARELESRIENALFELDEVERELIILRRLCEMTYAEMAETLDYPSEQAARKAFSRALAKLRQKVDG